MPPPPAQPPPPADADQAHAQGQAPPAVAAAETLEPSGQASGSTASPTTTTTTTTTTSPTLTQPPPTPATAGTSRPDPAHTRVLLRSLEELRDSLSVRVEQLSLAVDRLRGQATELERAVTSGTALAPGFGRPVPTSAARFDPLPAPSLAPRRYTTAAGTAADSTADRPREAGTLPRVGSVPTNLKLTAAQPKPIVVRSPRPSVEPAAPTPAVTVTDDGAGSGASTPQAHATTVLPPTLPVEDDAAILLRPPPRPQWTLSAVMERRPSPEPLDLPARPIRVRRISTVLDQQNRAPTLATLSARGITTRGMMVRERQGLTAPAPATAASTSSSDSSSDELLPFTPFDRTMRERTPAFADLFRFQDVIADHPPPARDIETLDREIQLYLGRLASSQREWTRTWEMERDRAMQGGRVPNEYSAQRESAMRNHVANSHRLWYLLSRRASRHGPRERDGVDNPPSLDATASRLTRGSLPPLRTSNARPVSVYAGVTPAIPNDATIEDMERRWIERIEAERAGGPTEASEDQFEYEYYRNYLYENRRSRRTLSSAADDSGEADDSWPQRRLELLELIAQSRSYVTGADAPSSGLLPSAAADPVAAAPGVSDSFLPSDVLDAIEGSAGPPDRPAFDFASLPLTSTNPGEDDFWHSRRRDLLEYIEQSRARVHDMARELSPSVLQEERPALRRVLEGLERMLALDDDMSPDMRARLERLAARERELLRDIGEEPPAPLARTSGLGSLASIEVTTRRGDRQRQVVERIERTRSRLRELSRIHRDLSTVRAGMGLAPPPRSLQSPLFSASPTARRDSDAETVVPSLGSSPGEETFWAADEDADDAEPTSGPTTGSNTGSGSEAAPVASFASLSLSAAMLYDSSDASSEPESTDAQESGPRVFAFEDDGVADKEGGLLSAETWPEAPRPLRRAPRPYVSLVDL
ncbi:hypothetical protein Q8F55_005285 [Vanrija albida]|uniref:DUF4048 domain-containing protein n=1 Tax=Vanrija albida TaxID=181172 RepID=A0ABR3Q171_9TREE